MSFRKHVYMNMNYSFLTKMYERDVRMHTVVTPNRAGKVNCPDF